MMGGPTEDLKATARAAFQAALACLTYREGEDAALGESEFGDAHAFACAACDSVEALEYDWKLTHEAVLDDMANRAAPQVYADFELLSDDEILLTAEDEDGEQRELKIDRLGERTRDDLVAAFVSLWPGDRSVLVLVPFDDSDMSAYLVVSADQLACLRGAMGAHFDSVLRVVAV
jgi:hypothetical protein